MGITFDLKISGFVCWFLVVLVASDEQRPAVSSCILVFGDSTVDPGNNNYLHLPFRANHYPYGKDFINHTSTGRWSNGFLSTDFIAKYLGIKESVPPYLDPTLSIRDLITGVSFASAGTGFDPLTPAISKTMPLSKQLELFREYKSRVEKEIGRDKANELINNALFIISIGTNDFLIDYYLGITPRHRTYNISSYTSLVGQFCQTFLQELHQQGARRIGVVGLPPMGCLPSVMTIVNRQVGKKPRYCNESLSSVARQFNQDLNKELSELQAQLKGSGSRFAYIDLYGPLEDMILHPNLYGFEEVKLGCCGTGFIEFSFLCNKLSRVCADADKYVFWDAFHPTQRTSQIVSQHSQPTIDYLTTL